MNRRLLIVVDSDPRLSARPAEAWRIAAGLGAWQTVDVDLYLTGAAVLTLGSDLEGVVSEDLLRRYASALEERGRPDYVERSSPWLAGLKQPAVRFAAIGVAELACLVANSESCLRF